MYKISKELAQGILNYLAQRPYAEVAGAIESLKRLEPLEGDEKLEVEKKEETKEETK